MIQRVQVDLARTPPRSSYLALLSHSIFFHFILFLFISLSEKIKVIRSISDVVACARANISIVPCHRDPAPGCKHMSAAEYRRPVAHQEEQQHKDDDDDHYGMLPFDVIHNGCGVQVSWTCPNWRFPETFAMGYYSLYYGGWCFLFGRMNCF